MWMFHVFFSRRAADSILGFASLLLVSGCANPGQPKPPSLRLPDKAVKVLAERLGNQVVLTWNTPSNTTDGDAIREPITAVICRETSGRPGAASACRTVQRVAVVPGPSHAAVDLLPALASGPPTLLTYRVELFNAHDRSAGASTPAFAAGGAAPATAGPLRLVPSREGALIAWQPDAHPGMMQVTRSLVTPDPPQPAVAKAAKSARPSSLNFGASKGEATTVVLQPEGTLASDPGGMLDRTAEDGNTYTYVGQRVQIVLLSGHSLELHGLPSPPATLLFRDIFPPRSPAGLVSVPGGGFGDAPSIDLSWDAGAESDLVGYNIYRSDALPGAIFTRLNTDPVPASAFRDLHVEPGHSYLYRVTAVDLRHNESPPGDTIHESLRK